MKPLAPQNVARALGELRDLPEYEAMESSGDAAFHELPQEVVMAIMRCFPPKPDPPTEGEIAERLGRMLKLCVGGLAKFRPYMQRAEAALAA